MNVDPTLRALLIDRARLLRQLAPLLRRVGPSHADRSARNHERATKRKAKRAALRANADAIASYCMEQHRDAI